MFKQDDIHDAVKLAHPAPNVLDLGVATYPESAAVTSGEILYLCVEPAKTFRIAFYFQGADEALSPVPLQPILQDLRWVGRKGATFTSFATIDPRKPDLDWGWPRLGFSIPSGWPSGVYFAVVYPVDASGVPTDDLGRAVVSGDPQGQIKPRPALPAKPESEQVVAWDHGMALFVVRPSAAEVQRGGVKVAYMIAHSTYHAYNNRPACFYYEGSVSRVTLRRPGGGVGSRVMLDERDPLDSTSMRNTYAHWDARFVRWLAKAGIVCHFYTTSDLDRFRTDQPSFLLDIQGKPTYPLLLSVGHDEYWSMAMRRALEAYLDTLGNAAIFSGNTCFRPIGFGAPSSTASRLDPPAVSIDSDRKTTMIRLMGQWPDDRNEASTIGVTWKTGAGIWAWDKRDKRGQAGYACEGSTKRFGEANALVGYECDATFAGHTPSNFVVLARMARTSGWDQDGVAEMGRYQRKTGAPERRSILFNAATTDWARLLPLSPSDTHPDYVEVNRITRDVIDQLSRSPSMP